MFWFWLFLPIGSARLLLLLFFLLAYSLQNKKNKKEGIRKKKKQPNENPKIIFEMDFLWVISDVTAISACDVVSFQCSFLLLYPTTIMFLFNRSSVPCIVWVCVRINAIDRCWTERNKIENVCGNRGKVRLYNHKPSERNSTVPYHWVRARLLEAVVSYCMRNGLTFTIQY